MLLDVPLGWLVLNETDAARYFVHNHYAGVSTFLNRPAAESERNATMFSIGALVPINLGRLGKSWRHARRIKELAQLVSYEVSRVGYGLTFGLIAGHMRKICRIRNYCRITGICIRSEGLSRLKELRTRLSTHLSACQSPRQSDPISHGMAEYLAMRCCWNRPDHHWRHSTLPRRSQTSSMPLVH